MGDRCYSVLQCNKAHEKIFIKLGYRNNGNCFPNEDESIEMIEEEANYGNYEELDNLAGEGIPFYGWNGQGSEYGPVAYASNGRTVDFSTCDEQGNLTVRFNEDTLDSNQEDIEECKKYVEILKQAKIFVHNNLNELAVLGCPVPNRDDTLAPKKQGRKKKNVKIK